MWHISTRCIAMHNKIENEFHSWKRMPEQGDIDEFVCLWQ